MCSVTGFRQFEDQGGAGQPRRRSKETDDGKQVFQTPDTDHAGSPLCQRPGLSSAVPAGHSFAAHLALNSRLQVPDRRGGRTPIRHRAVALPQDRFASVNRGFVQHLFDADQLVVLRQPI